MVNIFINRFLILNLFRKVNKVIIWKKKKISSPEGTLPLFMKIKTDILLRKATRTLFLGYQWSFYHKRNWLEQHVHWIIKKIGNSESVKCIGLDPHCKFELMPLCATSLITQKMSIFRTFLKKSVRFFHQLKKMFNAPSSSLSPF